MQRVWVLEIVTSLMLAACAADSSGDFAAGSNAAPAPDAMDECIEVPAEHEEGKMTALDTSNCTIAVEARDDVAARRMTLDGDARVELVGLADVVAALSTEGRRASTIDEQADLDYAFPDYLEGFVWDDEDFNDPSWFNQGVTGASDAFESGSFEGRRVMISSWYSKSTVPLLGSRITVTDYTDLADVRYIHILLADIDLEAGGGIDFRPVAVHAGGVVWYGDLLYVVDTFEGFRVFDLTRIVRADPAAREFVGIDGEAIGAFGYAYLLPQVARYQYTDDSLPTRFSFVGLDRSSDPPHLITGEYQRDAFDGYLSHWPVGEDGWLVGDGLGRVRADAIVIGGVRRMQGVTRFNGAYLMSTSSQDNGFDESRAEGPMNHNRGKLFVGRPGQTTNEHPAGWVDGAEDLYFDRQAQLVWTTAEYPGQRYVVGVDWSGG